MGQPAPRNGQLATITERQAVRSTNPAFVLLELAVQLIPIVLYNGSATRGFGEPRQIQNSCEE